MIDVLRSFLGFLVGGGIGLGFGLIQASAHRRNELRQTQNRFASNWAAVPGSMRRVAYLLVALVLVQVASPALFAGASAWWASAGVAIGYGALLGRQLSRRRFVARGAVPGQG